MIKELNEEELKAVLNNFTKFINNKLAYTIEENYKNNLTNKISTCKTN